MVQYQDQVNSFLKVYKPLASTFYSRIANLNVEGMPEPFFPVFGQNYAAAKIKIAFVGMETRGYGEMKNFMRDASESISKSLLREQEEFDSFEFTRWTYNFGMDFWSFVLKFLARFHGVENWKELKNRMRADILSSFAWANINTVERYEITAKKQNVEWSIWSKIKQASTLFDRGENIIRALDPHLIVIVHWDCHESWLTDGLVLEEKDVVGDHLWYLKIQPTNTHVVWTAHPTWLKFHGFDEYVDQCVSISKSKLSTQSLNTQ